MQRIRFRRRLVRLLTVGISVLFLVIHFLVPRFITEIRSPVVKLFKRTPSVSYALQGEGLQEIHQKEFQITTFDGLQLAARLTYTPQDTAKATIVLLHGIRSEKGHFNTIAIMLAQKGYNSVALDARAHGESEGQFCTFGVKEKQDVHELITHLRTQEQLSGPIGVWGQSLGAAVALQAMGTYPDIDFGIIESTFSDYASIVHDYFDRHVGVSYAPFSHYLARRAAAIGGFDANRAKPIEACKHIHQPVLVVHGDNDQRIDISYGRANYKAIPSTNKTFLTIEGATHLNVWKVGGEAYFKKVLSFLEQVSP